MVFTLIWTVLINFHRYNAVFCRFTSMTSHLIEIQYLYCYFLPACFYRLFQRLALSEFLISFVVLIQTWNDQMGQCWRIFVVPHFSTFFSLLFFLMQGAHHVDQLIVPALNLSHVVKLPWSLEWAEPEKVSITIWETQQSFGAFKLPLTFISCGSKRTWGSLTTFCLHDFLLFTDWSFIAGLQWYHSQLYMSWWCEEM